MSHRHIVGLLIRPRDEIVTMATSTKQYENRVDPFKTLFSLCMQFTLSSFVSLRPPSLIHFVNKKSEILQNSYMDYEKCVRLIGPINFSGMSRTILDKFKKPRGQYCLTGV